MDKRLHLLHQSELKQASRVPSNETRPPLVRSKTNNDKKAVTTNSGNNYNNKQNRYYRQNINNNNNRYHRKGNEDGGDVEYDNDDDDENQKEQKQIIKNKNKPRRSNDKAELNNDDEYDDNNANNILKKKKGGKNINHLLNFKFLRQEPYYFYEKDFRNEANFNKFSSKPMIFTKEMFLQANCQFLVNNKGDYGTHFKNPDTLVDWCKIEEVILRSHEQIACPICLYPPIAAKITKCGHIYCWSCILNYLALGENKWRKCPICFESIYKDDLKSVQIVKINEFKIGDDIELNLMFKEKSSTLIYPLNLYKFYELNKPESLNDFLKYKDYDCCKKYLKIQTINSAYINEEILKRESNELKKELETCEDSVKGYINEALSLVDKRINEPNESVAKSKETELIIIKSKSIDASDAFNNASLCSDELVIDENINNNKNNSIEHNEDNDDDDDDDSEIFIDKNESKEEFNDENKTPNSIKINTSNSSCSDLYSYFYQSEDGQRIYLNSLNLRCLIHEYNGVENCPFKIKAKIVAIDNLFMNNELRKRYKYLTHIPLHSEFQIVQLDLKEPILSLATLEKFDEQLKHKEQMRKEKEEREKKYEKRNYLRMNTYPTNDYLLNDIKIDNKFENVQDYNQEFPNISSTPSIKIESKDTQQQQQQHQGSNSSLILSDQASSINEINENQMSFAQKLKFEKKKVDEWPSLTTTKTPTNSNNNFSMKFSQRLTDTCKTPSTKQKNSLNKLSDDENESLPAPQYQTSFMCAIDAVFQNLELNSSEGNNKSKKNKKKTKNLLFST